MFVVVDLLLLARRARDLPAGFGREGSSRDSGSSGDTDPDAARFSRSSRRRFNFLPGSCQRDKAGHGPSREATHGSSAGQCDSGCADAPPGLRS